MRSPTQKPSKSWQPNRLPEGTERGTLTSARSGWGQARPEAKPRAKRNQAKPPPSRDNVAEVA
jgi:hypothetical protein